MPIDINMVQRGVVRLGWSTKVTASRYYALQRVLFGNPTSISADPNTGIILYDFDREDSNPISKEAILGLDPNRVNYGSKYATNILRTAYFNDTDTIDFNQVQNRIFGEPIESNWSLSQRMTVLANKKAEKMKLAHMNALEKKCAEMLFTGKTTVLDGGEQILPLTESLLGLSGSAMYTNPEKVILDAITAINKINGNVVRATNILMNPEDALRLTQSAKFEKLVNKQGYDLARAEYGAIETNGFVYMGTINVTGPVNIWAYGASVDGANCIPQGKAIVLTNDAPMAVGQMAVGRVLVADGNNPSIPMVMPERVNVYLKGEGDYKNTVVTLQTAKLPVITAIDSYGVITGIPSSV